MANKQYAFTVKGRIIVKAESRNEAHNKLLERLKNHAWLIYDNDRSGELLGDFEDIPD